MERQKFVAQLFDEISKYRSAIMGVAMLSVMIYHQHITDLQLFAIFRHFGYWGVEVFLLLSGLGVVRSLRMHGLKHYFVRRFYRIVPSCVIFGIARWIMYGCIIQFVPFEGGEHWGWWSLFSLDLWFIYAIIFYYIFAPLLLRGIERNPVVTTLTVLAIHLLFVLLWKTDFNHNWFNPVDIALRVVDRLPVFYLGMLLAVYKDKMRDWVLWVSLVALCLGFLCRFTPSIWQVSDSFISLLLAVATPAMVWVGIMLIRPLGSRMLRALEFTGRYSLELYLIHEFVLLATCTLLGGLCRPILMLVVFIGMSYAIALSVGALSSLPLFRKK